MLGANLKRGGGGGGDGGGWGLICVVDVSAAGSILHPVSRPRAGVLCLLSTLSLCPGNPLYFVPRFFLTLWPELDNGSGWGEGWGGVWG